MSDEQEPLGTAVAEAAEALESAAVAEPPEERDPAPPVESRFMFVDIAALRAKQLRRGALPRIDTEGAGSDDESGTPSRKLERIAIAEVQGGLIHYTIPPETPPEDEEADEGTATEADIASGEDTQS